MASPTRVKRDRDKPQFVPANGSSGPRFDTEVVPTTAQAGALGGFGAMLPGGISGSSGKTPTNIFDQIGSGLNTLGTRLGVVSGRMGTQGGGAPFRTSGVNMLTNPSAVLGNLFGGNQEQNSSGPRFDQERVPAGVSNPIVGNYAIPIGAESGRYRGNVDRPFYNELGSLLNQARTNISGLSDTQLRKLASYGLVEKAAPPPNIFSDVYGGGAGYGGGGYSRRRGGGGGRGGGGTTGGYTYGNNSVAAQVLNWRVATG